MKIIIIIIKGKMLCQILSTSSFGKCMEISLGICNWILTLKGLNWH